MGETARKLHIVPSEDEEERFTDVIPIETGKKIRKKAEATLKAGEMTGYLKEGNIYDAITIKLDIEDSINDITAIEGYEEAVKECMRLTIMDKWEDVDGGYEGFIINVIILNDEFGKNIDFRSVEGYEEAVKEVFFDFFDKGLACDALDVKKNLGKGVDFNFIKGYDKAVKRAFLHEINHAEIEEALKVINDFGEGIDLSGEIKKAFLILLRLGLPVEAAQLENGIDYDTCKIDDIRDQKDYERAVKQGVNACLKQKDESAAVEMEHVFGKGIVTSLVKKKESEVKKRHRGGRVA